MKHIWTLIKPNSCLFTHYWLLITDLNPVFSLLSAFLGSALFFGKCVFPLIHFGSHLAAACLLFDAGQCSQFIRASSLCVDSSEIKTNSKVKTNQWSLRPSALYDYSPGVNIMCVHLTKFNMKLIFCWVMFCFFSGSWSFVWEYKLSFCFHILFYQLFRVSKLGSIISFVSMTATDEEGVTVMVAGNDSNKDIQRDCLRQTSGNKTSWLKMTHTCFAP